MFYCPIWVLCLMQGQSVLDRALHYSSLRLIILIDCECKEVGLCVESCFILLQKLSTSLGRITLARYQHSFLQ